MASARDAFLLGTHARAGGDSPVLRATRNPLYERRLLEVVFAMAKLRKSEVPEGFVDARGRVVICALEENPDDSYWYSVPEAHFDAALAALRDRYRVNTSRCAKGQLAAADCNGVRGKPMRDQWKRDAIAEMFLQWRKTYKMKRGKLGCAGRLRQIWKPVAVIMVDVWMFD